MASKWPLYCLIAWCGGTYLVAQDVNFKAMLRGHLWKSAQESGNSRKDPAIGIAVNLPKTDAFRSPLTVDPTGATLLIYMGDCGSCSVKSLPLKELEKRWSKRAVLVYSNREALRDKSLQALPKRFHTVLDLDREIAAKLNVFVVPRIYVLNAESLITAIQPEGRDATAFLKELAGYPGSTNR